MSWFGGEPLLNFHCIEELSAFAKTYCQKKDIVFFSTITTNGTLLTRQMLESMKSLNFTFFQITIDGTQKEHDNVKVIKGKSAYEMTLRNICLITEIIPSAEISLRYNYTTKNLKPDEFVNDLNLYLPCNIRHKIRLSIMKVWQENDEDVDETIINKLIEKLQEYGYPVSFGPDFRCCYVDHEHYNCIFPNGKIDKCDNEDFTNCRGDINSIGEIVWNKDPIFNSYSVFSHNNECTDCLFLPICYGPCPVEREHAYRNSMPLKCRFQNKDKLWRYRIHQYCKLHLSSNL